MNISVRAWIPCALAACSGGSSNVTSIDAPPRAVVDAAIDSAPPPACPAAVSAPGCNGTTGLAGPLMTCSTTAPCMFGGSAVTTEIDRPTCAPKDGSRAADPVMMTTDDNGDVHYACVGTPAGAAPRPLIVWFHGAGGSADDLYNTTDLRAAADADDFTIVSVQGRNLHWFGPDPDTMVSGRRFDFLFRDLGTKTCNPDIRSVDQLIDQLVAGGGVDPAQIYAVGWSNGAFFAEAYGIARSTAPTPGGHYIAAVATYAGADPFGDLIGQGAPSCALSPYPRATVPLYAMHRTCDAIIPCDAAAESMPQLGGDVETWLGNLATLVGDPNAVDTLIATDGSPATACDATCGTVVGTANHLEWPKNWEPQMLAFLTAHPRS